MILKDTKSWPIWFKVTHLLQKDFFGKLTNITLAYLLSPMILQDFKEIFRTDP